MNEIGPYEVIGYIAGLIIGITGIWVIGHFMGKW